MSTYKTETLPVTINNETRDVECEVVYHDDKPFRAMSSSSTVALFRKGSNKIWKHYITLWPTEDGGWRLDRNACIMNRNGYRLIGWNNDDVNEAFVSKHNSASS